MSSTLTINHHQYLELWVKNDEIARWAKENLTYMPLWVRVEPTSPIFPSRDRIATFNTPAEAVTFKLRWL